ncbi:hypothetical protein PLICRDRAFT_111813 [Plicaturopsis crispa FD-325 SS-3]|nr:hypothetical protein PLICRDRAFT_111813 [Plicaturopsis crispa FD-325 SS-3]
MPPAHIAVLGGGLTGLSSAFHLARRFPASRITLLEKEARLGGWAQSERVEVRDTEGRTANVLLEAGPRTLRPNANSVLELINLLGLRSLLLTIPRTSPLALNRFLHLPSTTGLHTLPSSLSSLLTSPFGPALLRAVMSEPFRRPNRPPGATDESLDSFLSRRFGAKVAQTFGSALVHGVYAADSRNLSIRAAFPSLWAAEERGRGSVLVGMLRGQQKVSDTKDDYDLDGVEQLMQGVSVYTFKDGIEQLPKALVKNLEQKTNVSVRTNTAVKSIRFDASTDRFDIDTPTGALHASHLVSTLPLPLLSTLVPSPTSLPHLTHNATSSVTVFNLVFSTPAPPHPPIHPPGFGYLIPCPEHGYDAPGNPGILGVVFDATPGQDGLGPGMHGVTKMTAMIGGPHPSPIPLSTPADVAKVLEVIARQLGVPSLPKPLAYRIRHHADCIPTLGVGHVERMVDLRRVLQESEAWGRGRMEVIGAGVGGVSVGDCVEAGKRVGHAWT